MLQGNETTMQQYILNAGNEHLENVNKIKISFIITKKL